MIPTEDMRERAKELWRDLCEKDDRTSPAEYSNMALITFEELLAILSLPAEAAEPGEAEDTKLAALEYRYDELFDWISKQVSSATYKAEELEQGAKAWEELADSMHNGIMASFQLEGYYERMDAVADLARMKDALGKIEHMRHNCRSADAHECARLFGKCLDIAGAALSDPAPIHTDHPTTQEPDYVTDAVKGAQVAPDEIG